MANVYSGIIHGEYSKYTRLRINYTVSQEESTAVSTITMDLYAERSKGSEQYNNTGKAYYNLTGKGNTNMNFSWAASSLELYLGSSSTTVQHNDDGTASVTLSGYWYTGRAGSNYIPEAISISQNITLQTIPRASSVSGGSGNIGEKTTISISRASAKFTHTLKYAFGNLSGTIATGVTTSYEWTLPTSFYSQIPNAKVGEGAISCDTYNGNTLIGTKSVKFYATAPESSCRPTVSATIKDTNSTTIALTGNSSKLVKYKSTAQLVISSTVKNSSTISSVTVNGINVGTNSSITLNYSNVSADSFTIVTTDSRGYTNTSYVLTPSFVNYVPLTVNARFFRPQPTTGEVQLTYSGNYFNGSFGSSSNTLSITWKYKETTASSYTTGGTITPTLSGNTISSKTISLGTIFNYQKSYDFQLIAVDKLTNTTVNTVISVGLPVFNWGKDFFNVNGKLTAEKVDASNLPVATAITGISFDDVASGQKLNKSFIGTVQVNDVWYNLINIRHRNGYDDGIDYGLQIRNELTDPKSRLYLRSNFGGNWSEWEAVYTAKSLYDNASGSNGGITLSESAGNFLYLEVFYSTNRGNQLSFSSQKIYNPNGRDINLNAVVKDAGQDVMYMESSLYNIGGVSMVWRTKGSSHNYANSVGYYSDNTIYIFKVVGYR